MTIRAIIIDPAKRTVRQEYIEPNLATLQKLVGGYIEMVNLDPLAETMCYCDEEGKLKDNHSFTLRTRQHDPFHGAVVILGMPDDEGNDTSTHWQDYEIAEMVTWGPQYVWG